MPASDFDDFCAQLCGLLDLDPPLLAAGDSGESRAFTITHRGVEIGFVERKKRRQDGISMLVRLGPLPDDNRDRILATLMGAGYLMMERDGAYFVRDPRDGEIYLHRPIRLDLVNVRGIHSILDDLVKIVEHWSRDHFLRPDNDSMFPAGSAHFA